MTQDAQLSASEEEVDPLIGMELQGRYRIVRQLGEGGMGSVYEGEHLGIGKRVAIKCLNPQFTEDAQIVERFRREARAATAIGNEHIIDVTDMGELPGGAPYMVMEYLNGIEFAGLLENEGPLPIGRAIRIALQVCDALGAAHEAGIVHRDLKPENIFLIKRNGQSDFAKVLDFGISKMQSAPHLADASLTQTGIAMGTPHYMSPEQAQALKTLDHRTDIYALGVILYRALAGSPPFDAESYPMLMVQVITQDAAPLRQWRPDVPAELEAVIHRVLEKNPDNRYPDAASFAAALRPFASLEADQAVPAVTQPGGGELSGAQHQEGQPVDPMMQSGPRPSQHPGRSAGQTGALGGFGGEIAATRQLQSGDVDVGQALGALPTPAAQGDGGLADTTGTLPTTFVSRYGRTVLLVGGLLFLGGVGAAAWQLVAGPPEAANSNPTTDGPPKPESVSVPTPPEPDTTSTDSQQAAPQEVRIRIVVSPADAKIFIGDQQYPNPMDAPRPRSLDPVTLRIERDGYETIEEPVLFDQDQNFNFRLREKVPSRGRPSGGVRGKSPRGGSQVSGMRPPTREGIYQGSMRALRDQW